MTILGQPLMMGGGSSYTLIASDTVDVSTTSTTAISVKTINLGSQFYTSDKIIYVKVRNAVEATPGYFIGSDVYFFNVYAANAQTTELTNAVRLTTARLSSGDYTLRANGTTVGYGVYANSIDSNGNLTISARYSSSYSLTINGTYAIEVYALDYAPNGNPYDYEVE